LLSLRRERKRLLDSHHLDVGSVALECLVEGGAGDGVDAPLEGQEEEPPVQNQEDVDVS
jgi:hypothetical protein